MQRQIINFIEVSLYGKKHFLPDSYFQWFVSIVIYSHFSWYVTTPMFYINHYRCMMSETILSVAKYFTRAYKILVNDNATAVHATSSLYQLILNDNLKTRVVIRLYFLYFRPANINGILLHNHVMYWCMNHWTINHHLALDMFDDKTFNC